MTLSEKNNIEKYKDMSDIDFKNYMSEKYPNTCGRSDEDARRMWTWHMFGPECNKGWWGLFEDFCSEAEAVYNTFGIGAFVEQFKEKFGGPRLYVAPALSEEVMNLLGSDTNSKEKKMLNIIGKYLSFLTYDCEKKMGEVSELTGERLPYNFDNFSYHGWVWGSTPDEVIELYTKQLKELSDEVSDEKKRVEDIIKEATRQKVKNKKVKEIKFAFDHLLRFSDLQTIDVMKEKIDKDIKTHVDRETEAYNCRLNIPREESKQI